ncbi:MAG TPA: 2OG-Fe(II) oxygenase [Candidatus Nitrosotenuis sp.]|jgi:hypothetical protein|nr:2OG-Fe(II) oxygenase [Candidatus Nitrosotenuis sp.]
MAWGSLLFRLGLAPYWLDQEAFEADFCQGLARAILASPYLGASNLNYRFTGTSGFSLVFRGSGRPRAEREFPEMAPYLRRVVKGGCNAFYLNPLVIRSGGRVAPHVDRSLRSFTAPEEPPDPVKVSVLYLQVPRGMEGGTLVLHLPGGRTAAIQPRPQALLEFRGHLRHEVSAVGGPDGEEPRVSLVCEHYRLPRPLLERLPEYAVGSTSPFEAFLQGALGQSVRTRP